jgi:hypothetical protein
VVGRVSIFIRLTISGVRHEAASATSDAEAAQAFYDRILDHTVVMLLPGGMVLDERAAIVGAMSGQLSETPTSFRPW